MTVRARDRRGREIYRSPLSEARRTGQDHVVAWLEARGLTWAAELIPNLINRVPGPKEDKDDR